MKNKGIVIFNQVTGPLFEEMVLEISKYFKQSTFLVTGKLDRKLKNKNINLKIAPSYNRKNIKSKFISWISFSIYSFVFSLFSKKDDLFFLTTNPPILAIILYPLLRLKKIKYFLLIYDIYPDVITGTGLLSPNNYIIKCWNFFNKALYKNASLVLTISDGMKKTITSKYSLSNTLIINPWVDTEIIKPLRYTKNKYAKDYVSSDKFVVLYSGNMGLTHDIDTILEAAKILKDDKKIIFLLIGKGPGYEKVRQFIFEYNIKNIKLFPFQEQKKLKYILPLASISLVSLNAGLEDFLIPSKTFFYLSAGSPLISITNLKSDLSNLTIKNNIGFVSNPRDSSALARKIKQLQSDPNRLKEMQKNARELVINKFSKEIVLSDLIKILTEAKLLPNKKF